MMGIHGNDPMAIWAARAQRSLALGSVHARGTPRHIQALEAQRRPTTDLCQSPFERPHATLGRPLRDEGVDRLLREHQAGLLGFCGLRRQFALSFRHHLFVRLLRLQGVQAALLRQQMRLRDGKFLLQGVAGKLNHLHSVEQRPVDQGRVVRRADEEHPREVEGRVEVVVLEGAVLLRIQHLQQGRLRVEHGVLCHLIDLVQQDHGVVGTQRLHRLDDGARHAADVGSPVAPDLGFVLHASQSDPVELPAQGTSDGAPQRGLADAGRPVQTQDRPLHVASQLLHREELQQAPLDLVQALVVLVKQGLGAAQIKAVPRANCPGKRGHGVEVRVSARVLGMVRL
mmetsp:Transcript_100966/g.324135  ORF Transcript_100966/g.324135 Transcript_100966/m.324135 type:complete len:342 (+) Transcript_100966:976-2001(+)